MYTSVKNSPFYSLSSAHFPTAAWEKWFGEEQGLNLSSVLFPQCSHPCKINRTDLLLVKCTLSFTPDWNGNAKSSAICFQQGAAGKDGALGSSSPGQKPQQEPICPLQQGEGSQHKMGIFWEVLFCSLLIQALHRGGFTQKCPQRVVCLRALLKTAATGDKLHLNRAAKPCFL